MDDHSDDDLDYRTKRYSKKNDSSDSHLSISDDDEEDAGEPLEIRPPQAKIKHSHYRHTDKHSSTSRRSHHHKSHRSRRHQDEREERYFEKRVEPEFKSSRATHLKDYELERLKEYEEYRRKKYAHQARREEKAAKEERYRAYQEELQKEQDLREKLERRKLHQELKEQHRKERKERELKKRSKSDKEVYFEPEEKRRKRHDAEKSRKRERTPEKMEISRHKKSTLVFESEDPVKPAGKEMVVDVEMSPPVLKNEYEKYKVGSSEKVKEEEEEVEGEEREEEEEEEEEGEVADNSEEESSSDSSSSSSSSDDSDNSDSSSSSSSEAEEEAEEVESETKSVTNEEIPEEVIEEVKEETPPPVVATEEEEVDKEIELEKDTLPAYFPAIQGCRSVEEFQCLNHINEGTYGVVYRAKEKKTNKIVALKRLKMEKEKDGFPVTSLREINTLLKAQHPNIVTVKEIVVGSNMDKIFIVMDYVEHDLKSLMETMKKKKSSFSASEVKCLMLQLLRAVNHLHDNWILHRDLKTSNLLLTHGGILKVGDFGLAREYGSPLKPYTPVVVTLWYRAPELLLGAKRYSTFVDMWSVGCIFAEFLLMDPLFPGKAEIDQLTRIFKALGTPNETTWPEFFMLPVTQKVKFAKYPPNSIKSKFVPKNLTDLGFDLLTCLLTYNTKTRITADTALKHEYFNESPLPIDPNMFPTWPAKSEPGYRKAILNSPKPPPGGQANKEPDDDGLYIPADEKNSRGFNLKDLHSTFNLKF